ncbi:MAG: polysaccharide deacetylase [Clostridiales bacterium]|nr:polysaccharide deacetylase [Clostridiales bacterium]
MWNGKNKAFTFSFDDGAVQDERAIEILNKYGLKATFNIISGFLGSTVTTIHHGRSVIRDKVLPQDLKRVYFGHEIAGHTLAHERLTELSDDAVIFQVEKDREILSDICGYNVVGFAYPCGGVNCDDRVANLIKNNSGIKYARTIGASYNFDLPKDLYQIVATAHFDDPRIEQLAEEFVNLKTNVPKLFYVYGHTYAMDINEKIDWARFENLCKLISGKPDIFYGTNTQVLLSE